MTRLFFAVAILIFLAFNALSQNKSYNVSGVFRIGGVGGRDYLAVNGNKLYVVIWVKLLQKSNFYLNKPIESVT